MSLPPDYKVAFGSVARTLLYEDSLGTVRITFDLDTSAGQRTIILGSLPKDLLATDRLRADAIVERTKKHLLSCGYMVAVDEA